MVFGKALEVFCDISQSDGILTMMGSIVCPPALLQGLSSSFLAQVATSPGLSCGSPSEFQGRFTVDKSPMLSLQIRGQLPACDIVLRDLTIATNTRHEARQRSQDHLLPHHMNHLGDVNLTYRVLPQFRHIISDGTVPMGEAIIKQEGVDG